MRDTDHNDSQSCEVDGVYMYERIVARRTTVSEVRQCKVHWEPTWEDESEIHDLEKTLKHYEEEIRSLNTSYIVYYLCWYRE